MGYVIEPVNKNKIVSHDGQGRVDVGVDVEFGNNVILMGDIKIGNKCKIGNNTLLRSAVIGQNTTIEDNCILGYDNISGHFYDRGNKKGQEYTQVIIGENVLIRNGSTIYLGAAIHDNCWINHNAIIRENSVINKDTCIGSHCICQDNIYIGEQCLIHNFTQIAAKTRIESCVFIGPNVTLTDNSPIGYLRDLPNTIRGPILCFGCAIGGGATIYPGVVIGQESVVAGGSTVNRDVLPKSVVGGNPARKIKNINESDRIKAGIRSLFGIE